LRLLTLPVARRRRPPMSTDVNGVSRKCGKGLTCKSESTVVTPTVRADQRRRGTSRTQSVAHGG
jgi:hypothetical protein